MIARAGRVLMVTVLMLAFSSRAAAQMEWNVAVERITRLSPGAFWNLSRDAVVALEVEGCTVPQAWGENEPHNVIVGWFGAPGQDDWAVLCSKEENSSIVVMWGGPVSCPTPIAPPLADQSFLQGVGLDGILFSRGIASIRLDPRYWAYPQSPLLDSLTHDAISDTFYEKGATAYYCEGGVWLEFNGVTDVDPRHT